jgi:hypothetical protein
MNRSKQTTMAVKTIVVFLVGLVLASGCVQAVLLVIVLAMSLEQTWAFQTKSFHVVVVLDSVIEV